ncbi:UvrD-helicase domain-containing protein [Aeromonas salmonicida]|uniref:UvrD-helicase domain-containing protein n=1 Tax=Aeromonas salmonicida TaxID=645 RepID=UPI0035A5E04E
MSSIVFTEKSILKFDNYTITPEWLQNFSLPENNFGLKRHVENDITYIIEGELDDDNISLVVINRDLFDGSSKDINLWERILTVSKSFFTSSVVIPTTWKPHHEQSLQSIRAYPNAKDVQSRLHFNTRPNECSSIYFFHKSDSTIPFSKLDLRLNSFIAAKQGITAAILSEQEQHFDDSGRISLSEKIPQGFTLGINIKDWYDSKLTLEQRIFVDKPYDGPVRLKGAAGTGKTISLVIKMIRDAYFFEEKKQHFKIGFVAHSAATVDLVRSISESLDHQGVLYNKDNYCHIEIKTLYDLAQENLRFDLDHLNPLSSDGKEGRQLQYELITSCLKVMWTSPILKARFSDITPDLMLKWNDTINNSSDLLVIEIMNEFASVLDADSIRAEDEKGEQYAKSSANRRNWMMNLPTESDRRFVLEVHKQYRKELGEMNALSIDQMIADFNSFLDSNRWDRIRQKNGYDALFVDELHYFTAIERQTLNKVIKINHDQFGKPSRPAIFMAYDLKQSTKDSFIHYGEPNNNLFAIEGLRNSQLVEFNKVFRYTNEIKELLTDIDAKFPAIDIAEDWSKYNGESDSSGPKPISIIYNNNADLINSVYKKAHEVARTIKGGGRRVAVLCVSEKMFHAYCEQYSGDKKVLIISDREPSAELRHAGKRFILSMPEYVAGLQFDTVFLIHCDQSEAPEDASIGLRRQFISSIYLGASRAERILEVLSSQHRGGLSDVFSLAINRHSLEELVPEQSK